MYEDSGCSDPNSITAAADHHVTVGEVSENGFSSPTMAHINVVLPSFPQPLMAAGNNTENHENFEENLNLSMDELSNYHHHRGGDAMELEFQQQVAAFDNNNNPNNIIVQDDQITTHDSNRMVCFDQSNWVVPNHQIQEMGFNHHHHHQAPEQQQFPDSSMAYNSTQAPDLLNFFNIPRCSNSSLLPNNSSFSFSNLSPNTFSNLQSSTIGGFNGDHLLPASGIDSTTNNPSSTTSLSILYDPLFHLNLPPQPPLFRELFHSLPHPHGYSLPASSAANSSRGRSGGSLFPELGDIDRDGNGINGGGGFCDQDGDGTGILEFTRDHMSDCIGKGRDGKMTKHFATERQRRVQLNDKYKALRSLVPNPTKTDRASIVGDAIEYIKELLRTVKELKLLVEKKRCTRERNKRHRTTAATEDDGCGGGTAWDVESSNAKPIVGDPGDHDQSYNLRSSWLQRKSKDTEVDVRIIDDEVTIKLVQRKVNCLLLVSKLLHDLQLDLHHVAGGHIGDYYSFLFNTKIYEGSSVYASAIANKLIEVLDRQQNISTTTTPQTTTY